MSFRAFVLDVLPLTDVRCELIRVEGTPEVYLTIEIVGPREIEFDQHRPPIVWCDDRVGLDLGNSKSASDMLAKTGMRLTYLGREKRITAQIWSGEGPCPALDHILGSNAITIRIFTKSYDIIDIAASADETAGLVGRLREALRPATAAGP